MGRPTPQIFPSPALHEGQDNRPGELLDGKRIDMPPVRQTSVTYKRAPKATTKAAEQPGIFGED